MDALGHRKGAWSPLEACGALVLVGLAVVVTAGAWKDMLRMAQTPAQGHILLVPAVAAWLFWVRRGRLRRCARDQRWIGPVVVVAGWAVHVVGYRAGIEAFWHLGAVAIPVGCFLSFAGARYLVRLLPAFLVLAFLVPIPGVVRHELVYPLQRTITDLSSGLLNLLGVSGATATEIFVAEARGGLQIVFSLFVVSYAFAYGLPIREPVRVVILCLSPVLAVLCNVIRLVPSVWAYGNLSPETGRFIYIAAGWVVLPLAFFLLLGSFRLLRWSFVPVYRFTLVYGK